VFSGNAYLWAEEIRKTSLSLCHMTEDHLLRAFQSRTARVAVGASTVRGRGNAGVVRASRSFLGRLDLTPFGRPSKVVFARNLDRATSALRKSLPRKASHWGLARKVVNIFLRDCLYTTYLNEAFDLRQSEPYLELPLDSITAKQIKRAAGRGELPAWPGVKNLTQSLSARFQEAAAAEAARRGIARVHLDAIWWSMDRDGDAV